MIRVGNGEQTREGACANERRKGGRGKDPTGRRERENMWMFTMEMKARRDKNKKEKVVRIRQLASM
jgi:hypothetical protein